VGHALGALIGLQLALSRSRYALVCVNGWLSLNAHTRRCFQIRERLLRRGAQAWVEAQPLFLYPADWMAARAPRRRPKSLWRWPIFRANTTCCAA
jgi:aminoacrylate hydrolase